MLKNKKVYKSNYQNFKIFLISKPFKFLTNQFFNRIKFLKREFYPLNFEKKQILIEMLKRYSIAGIEDYEINDDLKLTEIFEKETKKHAYWGGKQTENFIRWKKERKISKKSKIFKIDIKSEFSCEISEVDLQIKTFLDDKFKNFNEIYELKLFIDKYPLDLDYYYSLAIVLDSDLDLENYLETIENLSSEDHEIFSKIKNNGEMWLLDLNELSFDTINFLNHQYLKDLENWVFNFIVNNNTKDISLIFPILFYFSDRQLLKQIGSEMFLKILKRDVKNGQKNKKESFFKNKFLKEKWNSLIEPIKKYFSEKYKCPNYLEIIKFLEKEKNIDIEYFKDKTKIKI